VGTGPLTGATGPVSTVQSGDAGVSAGVGALTGTVIDGIGVTRETNVQPVGELDSSTGGSILIGKSDGMGNIPKPLFDWVYLTQGLLTSTAPSGATVAPYDLWRQIDYVGHVLHGKTFRHLELEVLITLSPTAFHMGVVTFAWLPEYLSRTDLIATPGDWGFLRSRKHTVTVNLAAPQVVVLKCPLVRPAGALEPITFGSPQMGTRDRIVFCARGLGRVDGAYTDVAYVMQARLVPGSTTMGLTASEFVSARRERPWSGALGALSAVAGHLSNVPVLSGVMLPAERFLKAGAVFAKSMGLSAPVSTDLPGQMVQATTGSGVNADLGTNGAVLSTLTTTQRAVTAPFTDGEPDECAFATIAARPGHVATFTLSSTRLPGQGLVEADTSNYAIPVDPLWRSGSSSTYNAGIGGVAWLALAHTFWRGTLRYKLTVVASKFHSMRLRVIYDSDPMAGVTYVPTREAAAYTYSEVFDISEQSVIEFDIPWCAPRAWNPCERGITKWSPLSSAGSYIGAVGPFNNPRVHHNGVIYFMVESSLVSAFPAVADALLLVEVVGGDDFAVAYHDIGRYYNAGKTIPVSAVVGADAHVPPRALGKGVDFREPFKIYGMDGITNVRTLCKEMVCVGPAAPTAPTAGGGPTVTPSLRAWMGPLWSRFHPTGRQTPATQNYWERGYGVVSGGSVYRVTSPLISNASGSTGTLQPGYITNSTGSASANIAGSGYDFNHHAWNSALNTGFTPVTEGWASTVATIESMITKVRTMYHGLSYQFLGLAPYEVTVPMIGTGAGMPGWYFPPGGSVDLGQIEVPATLFMVTNVPNSTGADPAVDLPPSDPLLFVGASDDYNLSYFDGPPRFAIMSYYENP